MTKSQAMPKFAEEERIGITRYSTGTNWNRNLGDLTMQGGKTSSAGAVKFVPPFLKQVLYLDVAGGTASGESLTGFTSSKAGYWYAIGV